jgi:hypothetical protein
MTDDLFDRIVKVLVRDSFGLTTKATAHRQATAIILELGLQPEISFGTNYPNVPVTDRKFVRWVTDWKADDE